MVRRYFSSAAAPFDRGDDFGAARAVEIARVLDC